MLSVKKSSLVFIVLFLGGIHQPSLACKRSIEEKESKFEHAVVVADFAECSKIGRDMLKEGGDAVDAAIAAMLCVGIYNCHSAGIGGGHTTVIYNRESKETHVVNAREKSSEHVDVNMFKQFPQSTTNGTMFIAVPGEVKGYWELHSKYGRLEWKELFEPAIKLARNGFKVHAALAKALKNEETHIRNDPGLRSVFLKGSGVAKEGDKIVMTKLADTLQTIADDPNSFYTGSLAQKINDELKKTGYEIDRKDLANYRLGSDTPLTVGYPNSNFTMHTARPPANGVIAAYMLNILNEFGPIDSHVLTNQTAKNLFYHRYVEASKFACANMHGLGDEDVETDVKKTVTKLIDKDEAKKEKQKIRNTRTSHELSFYGESGMGVCNIIDSKGLTSTSHVSVIDKGSSAVAMTSSINSHFGAKFLGPETGIIYNNHIADFIYANLDTPSLPAISCNLLAKNKRPMSKMSPMIFVDDITHNVILVTGGAGASTITPSTLQVALNHLWFGKSVRDSVQKTRLFYNSSASEPGYADGDVVYEEGFDSEVINALKDRCHRMRKRPNGLGQQKLGVVQLAARKKYNVYGYSDKRKKGAKAAGI